MTKAGSVFVEGSPALKPRKGALGSFAIMLPGPDHGVRREMVTPRDSAEIFGPIGIHKSHKIHRSTRDEAWSITHVPSGYGLSTAPSRELARAIATTLAEEYGALVQSDDPLAVVRISGFMRRAHELNLSARTDRKLFPPM